MKILADAAPLLGQCFEQAVGYVRKHLQDVPKEASERWNVERENGVRVLNQRTSISPDYLAFLGSHSEEIKVLTPFSKLVEVIRADPRVMRAFLGTEGTEILSGF